MQLKKPRDCGPCDQSHWTSVFHHHQPIETRSNHEFHGLHLAFQVDNLDRTMTALQQKGIPITDGPTTTSSGSRFVFIDAPDGYEVELIERPAGAKMV